MESGDFTRLTTGVTRLEPELRALINTKPRLMILGIGENRMGDDGAGQYISFNLDLKLKHPQIKMINGGITPEHRLDEIIAFHPNLMLVVDSIKTNTPPGTIKVYDEATMLNYLPVSSHSLPLHIVMDRIKKGAPGVVIKLLGISPFSLEFHDRYELFDEAKYSLDDKEQNLNIPFYAFNFSAEMVIIGDAVVGMLFKVLKENYK